MTDADASVPSRERPARVSPRPALIVIAIVAVIAAGGGLLTLFSSGGTGTRGNGVVPSHLIVEGVHFGPARAALETTEHGPLIPEDIIASLALPVGARLTGMVNLDDGSGPFDREIDLVTSTPRSQLITAFGTLLDAYGWRQSGAGTAVGTRRTSGTELLAQRPSRDGYNWEVGVTITAGASSEGTVVRSTLPIGRTRIAMRLLQVPEGN